MHKTSQGNRGQNFSTSSTLYATDLDGCCWKGGPFKALRHLQHQTASTVPPRLEGSKTQKQQSAEKHTLCYVGRQSASVRAFRL